MLLFSRKHNELGDFRENGNVWTIFAQTKYSRWNFAFLRKWKKRFRFNPKPLPLAGGAWFLPRISWESLPGPPPPPRPPPGAPANLPPRRPLRAAAHTPTAHAPARASARRRWDRWRAAPRRDGPAMVDSKWDGYWIRQQAEQLLLKMLVNPDILLLCPFYFPNCHQCTPRWLVSYPL